MEGFWGIIKRERYYGKRFTDRESLIEMIEEYISYYNNKRLQRNLGVLTPMEKHETYLQAAVTPTRKTGGSTDGYKPLMLGQRLKALAFDLLQPLCF